MDLLATLGGATLAVSAIVLGASMFPPNGNSGRGQEPLRPPAAARSISVSASTDHPTRFSYDPTASYDGVFCLPKLNFGQNLFGVRVRFQQITRGLLTHDPTDSTTVSSWWPRCKTQENDPKANAARQRERWQQRLPCISPSDLPEREARTLERRLRRVMLCADSICNLHESASNYVELAMQRPAAWQSGRRRRWSGGCGARCCVPNPPMPWITRPGETLPSAGVAGAAGAAQRMRGRWLLRAGDRSCNSFQTYIRLCPHKLCVHHCRCRRCGRAGDAGAAAAARAALGVGPCRGAHAGGGGARAPAHHAAGVDLHSQRCGEVVVH